MNKATNGSAVGKSIPHESAALHVSGSAVYTDDLPLIEGTLHGAFVLATVAHARILKLDFEAARKAPGVVAVLTAGDIPGENNCGPSQPGDPIFADKLVEFHGQVLALVVGESREAARSAARLVRAEYDVLPAILRTEDALAAESWILPPVEVTRGEAPGVIAASPHKIKGTADVGGQEHFYLEGQVAYALPREQDALHVQVSTQHPTEMQQLVAHMLGWHQHQVSVECRRMGGGFGGKETQSAQVACAAALAAWKLGRPVRLRLDRDDDFATTGKRHDFHFEYEAGFDDRGQIRGLNIMLASRCGYSADLSGPINDRAIFHIDNCYYLDAVAIRSLRCKTNTVSNTAFRGFGGPQGMFAIECVIDDIARHLGLDPLDVRRVNLYGDSSGDERVTTHYGMKVEDNIAPALIDQLAAESDYKKRRADIAVWNARNRYVKRGIALTPVKFGISFTATFYNQAGAIVHVYADGSVLVTHGGTEMGQGLYTKIRQIVAHEFGLDPVAVRFSATDTSRVPNTSATAASSGTDLNGKAAQAAAVAIRTRLAEHFVAKFGLPAEAAGDVRFEDGLVFAGGAWVPGGNADGAVLSPGAYGKAGGAPARSMLRGLAGSAEKTPPRIAFADLVADAYRARVKLWDSGFYRTPKIHYDSKTMKGRPFFYFSYGAACAEVAVDLLTGENKLLRVDILHDVGRSINPGIDIGQIEGGFIQGMGWLTTEELWWHESGAKTGLLATHAPSTYKIPSVSDTPPVFKVALFEGDNVEDSIHKSKAVGEPPLMLALSVYHALRDAVAAGGGDPRRLAAPATAENVLRAFGTLG